MASGRLGAADLSATTNTTIYTVPSGKYAALTISIANRNTLGAKIRLAISATATPGNSEWIEYDAVIPPNGVLERSGIVIGSGQYLVVYSDIANLSVVAYGIEDQQ